MSDISAGDAVKLSPFNNAAIEIADMAGGIAHYVRVAFDTVQGEVQTVTANSPNVLQAGVPIYVNELGISTANAFMTVFIITLCLLAISLVVVALGYTVVFGIRRREYRRSRAGQPSDFDYLSFVISWYFCMVSRTLGFSATV